jgi:hypothetical protein
VFGLWKRIFGVRKKVCKRFVGTGKIYCKKCGVHFMPGDIHPPFYMDDRVVRSSCPYVGEMSSKGAVRDDWNADVHSLV